MDIFLLVHDQKYLYGQLTELEMYLILEEIEWDTVWLCCQNSAHLSWLGGQTIQCHVEKLQFSSSLDLLFSEISYSLSSFCVFPKDCSFTCIFHSLGKLLQTIQNAMSSHFVFHFLSIRSIRNQKLNNQTYIHLHTGSFIHKYICRRSLSGDLLSIIIPF